MERDFRAFLLSEEYSDIEEFFYISRGNRLSFEDDKITFLVKYFIRESTFCKKYTMKKHYERLLTCVIKKFASHINKPSNNNYNKQQKEDVILSSDNEDLDIYERYENQVLSIEEDTEFTGHEHIFEIETDMIANINYCHKLIILKNGLPIPYVCKKGDTNTEDLHYEEDIFQSVEEVTSDNDTASESDYNSDYDKHSI